ncbi:DUF998 domain-containing protein [Kitasatospora sp. NPDC059160]|uniref:DUF998 domain-containing protein n=1 Tax=Kitasatospora sp. NPDC059160 TaxID=3346748 RepID=UPI0036BE0601
MAIDDEVRAVAWKSGAVALVVAAVQYVVAEAIAASAWRDPVYDYAHNFISDLGVPSCGGVLQGRTICSPLNAVMNAGFIAQGLLFVAAALVLQHLLPGWLRWAYLVLAVVHGVGIVLVGLVHGSPEADRDGSMAWHGLGAGMAIIGGNLLAVVVGGHLVRSGRARWPGRAVLGCGAVGLVCAVVLLTMMPTDPVPYHAAVFERGSVYSITAAELIAGATVLRALRGLRGLRGLHGLHGPGSGAPLPVGTAG